MKNSTNVTALVSVILAEATDSKMSAANLSKLLIGVLSYFNRSFV